ncbi:DNA-binding protein, partial [Xenorhabdus griffiniae]
MFLTANELIGLPALPGSVQGMRMALNRLTGENPEFVRQRQGSKAMEYHIDCLPDAAREAVRGQYFAAVLAQPVNQDAINTPVSQTVHPLDELQLMRQCPALLSRELSSLTEQQRQVADARALLALEVLNLRDAGMSRSAAVQYFSDGSRQGTLPPVLQAAADNANARKGNRRGIGTRALQEWVTLYQSTNNGDERLALLSPGHNKEVQPEQVQWFPLFLSHYRNVNGPSLQAAYRSFIEEWQQLYADQPAMLDAQPSYDAVRRVMAKLPKREKAR